MFWSYNNEFDSIFIFSFLSRIGLYLKKNLKGLLKFSSDSNTLLLFSHKGRFFSLISQFSVISQFENIIIL